MKMVLTKVPKLCEHIDIPKSDCPVSTGKIPLKITLTFTFKTEHFHRILENQVCFESRVLEYLRIFQCTWHAPISVWPNSVFAQ